ncbi:mechanosensitive ion channel family protein [Dyadobacter chenwenxiniae]|uniref:Mechanosensitive ion channel family protein n=1 Tax=Dyadobacter chenwenxiniae TaxID=2906456 RepID=A0A9X1PQ17_9BACT|nr:mechanosensitive ion channel domain-containing protein [Dyadobacter chenwenxiniae]MCF0064958.1 mechanosensitive ion channel family protein [Dyadobacter chenwenxiniae]UON83079.1 mechanosensitive ion channel family protein [Dyadobacter chenwenxiniae]
MNEFLNMLDYRNSPWLIVLPALIIGLIISAIVINIIKITAAKKEWQAIRAIRENLTSVLYFFIPLVLVTATLKTYSLTHKDYYWTFTISKVALIVVTTWLMTRIVIIIEKVLIDQLDFSTPDNNQARRLFTKIKFVKRIVIILIIIIGISILLLSFESVRQYGVGILTSAGIFSVIIGFAAQKSLANLMAGIQIAFTQPIKIDDVVIVEGEWGRIEEINLTYVVVNIWDLRRIVLPITYFIETPFQNWTRNDSALIGTAFFQLNYLTPVPKLREKLKEILDATPLWDGKSWALQVTDTQGQLMVVRALMSARNSSQTFDLRCLVREKMIEFISQEYPEALPSHRIEEVQKQESMLPETKLNR